MPVEIHQIAERHRDMPALANRFGRRRRGSCDGIGLQWRHRRLGRCSHSRYVVEAGYGCQHYPPMTEQYADVLEVLIGEVAERRDSNAVLSKALRVLGHAEFFKPLCNLRQCGTPPTHFAVLAGKDI